MPETDTIKVHGVDISRNAMIEECRRIRQNILTMVGTMDLSDHFMIHIDDSELSDLYEGLAGAQSSLEGI